MSVPILDGRVRSDTALLDAYTAFYPQYEAFYEPLQPDNALNKIGVHIGAGCLLLAKGNAGRASEVFDTVREPLDTQVALLEESSNGRGTTARLMRHTLNMLTLRDQPEAVRAERHAMHSTIASELDRCLQAAEDFYAKPYPSEEEITVHGDRRGLISHLTVLGVTTREPKSDVLSMSSLAHHDWSADSTRSHDNLLLTLDDTGMVDFYPVQVKAGCINACRDVKGGRWYKTLGRYDPSIAVVSGHCDLGFDQESRLATQDDHFPLASLLVKEAFGKPTAAEIDRLDMSGEQLVATIQSGERNGLAGVVQLA